MLATALLLAGTAIGQGADRTATTNYVLKCIGCHLQDGSGLPSAGIPDFVGKVGVFARLPEGRAYLLHVPGVIGSSLSDREIADLLNYVMDIYAGESLPVPYEPFTADEVAALRATEIGNVVKYRRVIAAKLAEEGIELADYPWP
ncbi:hypothetical protein OSH11_21285 [Kaistia dalseonensis]|uniref:Mono/diheme cytochrome c family protein n=1 Tax=Kaistia dalseonensis TaxID=410840 RepID=A0ABU0HC42_9HYPH|nr:hypothetical protein [Kaistia dalseonensis]MCX5497247.1 hypothetical protein [Kaistia dalseonensis]MDQ0439879.1 mono/diheme cytochrome c family protein [Kaistia dalseonensis]